MANMMRYESGKSGFNLYGAKSTTDKVSFRKGLDTVDIYIRAEDDVGAIKAAIQKALHSTASINLEFKSRTNALINTDQTNNTFARKGSETMTISDDTKWNEITTFLA
eukprot:TRINITY_DN14897_c0_g1_i1.p1 TRINITY_DN14897_c0_g1~~TRINITY_DN14897_c0_g1_i1.p1  ORF type:complete len:108 (-),score=15.66 TRINITY_DN14897_c0_g1_i1:174-497(-)